jgi:hypothetical protein
MQEGTVMELERYIVFKLSKVSSDFIGDLADLCEKHNVTALKETAVVVESDWPEYGPTVEALKTRITRENLPPLPDGCMPWDGQAAVEPATAQDEREAQVPRKALADFIEYSVHGPYGCNAKWLSDKHALVAALYRPAQDEQQPTPEGYMPWDDPDTYGPS